MTKNSSYEHADDSYQRSYTENNPYLVPTLQKIDRQSPSPASDTLKLYTLKAPLGPPLPIMLSFFTTIWRPSLPESIDGKPLLKRSIEFVPSHFPYHRLPENLLLNVLMRPEVVVALVVLYLWSEKPVAAFRDAIGLHPKSPTLRALIASHNAALALFSAVTAYYSWAVVAQHWINHGFYAIYCDADGSLWKAGLGAWSTIFYLSKYYEFLDTWILVLKNKPASFLQTYHHAGIVLTMYGGVASQSAWLLFVVLLNSVIHTVMYVYFTIKTIAPATEIKAARYLTMAQIGQFFTGILSTLGILFLGGDCDTQSSRFSLFCLHGYGMGLIALFLAFAKQKYKKS